MTELKNISASIGKWFVLRQVSRVETRINECRKLIHEKRLDQEIESLEQKIAFARLDLHL